MSRPSDVQWRGPIVSRRTRAQPGLPRSGTRGALLPGGAGEVVNGGNAGRPLPPPREIPLPLRNLVRGVGGEFAALLVDPGVLLQLLAIKLDANPRLMQDREAPFPEAEEVSLADIV